MIQKWSCSLEEIGSGGVSAGGGSSESSKGSVYAVFSHLKYLVSSTGFTANHCANLMCWLIFVILFAIT